jgi:2-polyprenyl-3-methyl-5-hydroxy-6-metoxy-1,4-benzoquinol methylase
MGSAIEYHDDEDHLTNGVLRLLDLDRAEFGRWIELSEAQGGVLLDALAGGWAALRPAPGAPNRSPADAAVDAGPGGRTGTLWHPAIGENPAVGFARSDDDRWAWLVAWSGSAWERVDDPPPYEEEYFEGGEGGYGAYGEEAKWRLEKAARQVREMRSATGLEDGRVLDIGSGYGYFRVALEEAGYEHEGLEVSEHGRAVASQAFGQDTHAGHLEDHWQQWEGRYSVVTAFDLIEHVADPVDFLTKVRQILQPGGFVGLKTPNIDAPEAEVFGPHYHSLKREHLVLFSPESLTEASRDAGFEPVEVTTVSHLLRGFVGDEECRRWEHSGRGADIVAWYRVAG